MSVSSEYSADRVRDHRNQRGLISSQKCCVTSRFFASLAVMLVCTLRQVDVVASDLALGTPVEIDQSRPTFPVQLGWEGEFLVGRWSQAVVETHQIPVGGRYVVQVTAPDPDGHRVTFSSTAVELQPGRRQLRGFFRVGRLNPEIGVRVVEVSSRDVFLDWNSTDPASPRLTTLNPDIRVILTTGNASGFDWSRKSAPSQTKSGDSGNPARSEGTRNSTVEGAEFRTISTTVERLPVDVKGYDGVSLLVLAGRNPISEEQSTALGSWVLAGGRLMISLPTDLKTAQQIISPLSSWLPVRLGSDEVTVRNFGKLEFFAGRNIRIPFVGRMSVPAIKIENGEYLAGGRDDALLVRAPYGLGSVCALAMDLTEPPLKDWSEVSQLGRRIATSTLASDIAGTRPSKSLQLSSSGVSDFATQIHAVQEDFADVNRASPWFVMGLLCVLLLAIGPLDYVIVHRLFQRPRATWITFPASIVLATLLSSTLATSWNGVTPRVNQLNLIDVDVETSTCHQKLWTNFYSPTMDRKSVTVRSAIPAKQDSETTAIHSSWSGVPEPSFGGMLRPTGLDISRADYRQTLDGQIERLPLIQWSSKPLVTEVHTRAERLVESDLVSTNAGRLSGTIVHRFAGPIEDWFLVYGNRVYRQMKKREDSQTLPIAPSQRWRVEQPNVFQRELRAFLTGEVAASRRRDDPKTNDIINRHAEYDPLSRDPAEIFRTLTFYHASGGREYTGLSNHLLEAQDLSHLVKLGRAVLFGRLQIQTARIQVDGAVTEPSRESTFVRLILPVRKISSELVPEIDHLGQ